MPRHERSSPHFSQWVAASGLRTGRSCFARTT
jgi:hypothetical protein